MQPYTVCVRFCLFGAAAFFADKTIGPSIVRGDEIPPARLSPPEVGWSPIPTPEPAAKAQIVPKAPSAIAKDRIHIIVINGNDPLGLGGLDRFCSWIEAAGYKNVYPASLRGYWYAEKKISSIHKDDPGAKIVVVGYSWGRNVARTLCHALEKKEIRIDLLVYLSGDMVDNNSYSRPPNVKRIVNINAHGSILYGRDLVWNGSDIDGAVNYRINCMHLGTPRQTKVLDILLAEIAAIR